MLTDAAAIRVEGISISLLALSYVLASCKCYMAGRGRKGTYQLKESYVTCGSIVKVKG